MKSGWRCGILGIIALFMALLIIRWQTLPIFLDIYYHAGCMTGFRDAGGIVLHDFWEYAPIGRPHLYPPLFHLILLGLSKSGLPTLFILRFVSAAIYPLFLLTISWVVSRLYNDRCAFFTVLAATLPYTFLLNIVTAIPSSIALIILVLLFYAIETKRTLLRYPALRIIILHAWRSSLDNCPDPCLICRIETREPQAHIIRYSGRHHIGKPMADPHGKE